jgi:hypothetical protein
VINYTTKPRKFRLYIELPSYDGDTESEGIKIENVTPKPTEFRQNRVVWDLKSIPSSEKLEINFELVGLDKDEYDENELYFEGIDPLYIVGAEPWQDIE